MTAREVNATVRTVTHAWLDIPGVQSWLELPNGYWNLDYDDPVRREVRSKIAYQTMLDNRIALDALALEDILPKVYERTNGQITIHTLNAIIRPSHIPIPIAVVLPLPEVFP